jgi:hypothetical protein
LPSGWADSTPFDTTWVNRFAVRSLTHLRYPGGASMKLCQNAIILVGFVWGSAAASAAPAGFEPADRALLADYARDTWRSIAAMSEGVLLPADS